MELRKELPEVFEEFAEARKNSFLAIKKIKDAGTPIVGVFCTYLPREIANAMGAAVVGLCSVSDETIPDAEKDLPRNLCPLIKSSYGFAKTDKCPFFYFSDLVVGETTCDGKKKMYEMLAEFKPVHVVQLPNSQTEDGYELYRKELIRFKEVLEEKFEVKITEEAIAKEIKKFFLSIDKRHCIVYNATVDKIYMKGAVAIWLHQVQSKTRTVSCMPIKLKSTVVGMLTENNSNHTVQYGKFLMA